MRSKKRFLIVGIAVLTLVALVMLPNPHRWSPGEQFDLLKGKEPDVSRTMEVGWGSRGTMIVDPTGKAPAQVLSLRVFNLLGNPSKLASDLKQDLLAKGGRQVPTDTGSAFEMPDRTAVFFEAGRLDRHSQWSDRDKCLRVEFDREDPESPIGVAKRWVRNLFVPAQPGTGLAGGYAKPSSGP